MKRSANLVFGTPKVAQVTKTLATLFQECFKALEERIQEVPFRVL